MYWHIDTDIVSLIVLAAIYIFSRHLLKSLPEEAKLPRNRMFLCCLHVGIVVTFVDIVASVVMETQVSRLTYHVWMTLYFLLVEFIAVQYFLYVISLIYRENERGFKLVPRVVVGFYLPYAVLVLSNPWTGFIYTLGQNNEYVRGPFFSLMIIMYVTYMLAMACMILARWKHIPKEYPALVLLLTPFVIGLGVVVQLATPGWLMIMPAFMICMVLAFLFLQIRRVQHNRIMLERLSRDSVTDKLTGLFNRTGMETETYRTWAAAAGKGCLVVIADIDDLKGINAKFGYSEGDRVIQTIAEQLMTLYEGTNKPVRYGGDEFLILSIREFDEEEISAELEKIVERIGKLHIGKYDDIPLHCSVGAAFGVIGRDSFELLCNRADSALYHVKRNGKNGYAFFWPEMEKLQTGTSGDEK